MFARPESPRGRFLLLGAVVGAAVLVVAAVLLLLDRAGDRQALDITFAMEVTGDGPVTFDPAVEFREELGAADVREVRITEAPDRGAANVNPDRTMTYDPPPKPDTGDRFALELLGGDGQVLAFVDVEVRIDHQPDVTASERTVDFAEICVWCTASTEVVIEAASSGIAVESLALAGDDADLFSIEHNCGEGAPHSCEAQITYAPIRPGDASASLEVRHSGTDRSLLIPLHGAGTCERPDDEHTALLDDAVGFGREATGGAEGCLVRVTSLEDDGPGTLREAAERPGPSWIVFDVSGEIDLDGYVRITRDKTIDGRGASIVIEDAGIAIVDTPNVVIANLEIRDVYDDGLQIRGMETEHIWVHHVTFSQIADGYIDVTRGATNVTISWCRFLESPDYPQEKTILVGASDPGDPDERSRVTIHHNLFDGTEQRHPLLRAGRVHLFNNYFASWGIYGAGVSQNGQLLSERNIYAFTGNNNEHRLRAFTPWDEAAHEDEVTSANIRSVEDLFLNDASGTEANPDHVFEPQYDYEPDDPSDGLRETIIERAGWING